MLKIHSAEKHANSNKLAEQGAHEGFSETSHPLAFHFLEEAPRAWPFFFHEGAHLEGKAPLGAWEHPAEEGSMPKGKSSSQAYQRTVSKLSISIWSGVLK